MGLTNRMAGLFIKYHKILESKSENSKCLSLGTVDFWATHETIKKIDTIMDRDYNRHKNNKPGSKKWFKTSKKLCKLFFKNFGYTSYEELDINERADISFNLNYPVPDELKNKFDLIWDVGTIEHILMINQAFKDIIEMLKINGKIVHTQGIGDQTNQGYWTISPNFYFDFYTQNGFKIDKIILFNDAGDEIECSYVKEKGSSVGSLIPLHLYPGYYFNTILSDLNTKIMHRYYQKKSISKQFSAKFYHLLNILLKKMSNRKKIKWGCFVVLTKKKDIGGKFTNLIQNIYRNTSTTNITNEKPRN